MFNELKNHNLFVENGGSLRGIFFAGLPDACRLVQQELGSDFWYFLEMRLQ